MAETEKKKLFDVAHPDKAAPSATSRPIIVAHGPLLPDPMVQNSDKTAPPVASKAAEALAPSGRKKLQPSADDAVSVTAESDRTSLKAEDNLQNAQSPHPPASEEKEKPAATAPETAAASDAVLDSVVDQATAKKRTSRSG